ncbi:hypothetical protein ACYZTL_26660 [Pseudomonas sp. LB3P81]
MRAFLVSLFLVAALSGCAGSPFTYDQARQIKVGMPESQVSEIMGPPYQVVSRGEEQMWIWSHANGLTGASQVISFKMKDGKVTEVPVIPTSFK